MTADADPEATETDGGPAAADFERAAELAAAVSDGDRRLHELDDHTDPDTAAAARRLLVEEQSGADCSSIGAYGFPAEAAGPNIENMIGTVQVPLGVVGPVDVNGGALDDERYLPLATTEGALLASVNRGCSVINRAGGATARVTKAGMTRGRLQRRRRSRGVGAR